MQTYKKVLLILLIICLSGINHGCHKKVLPTTYPNKPGFSYTRTYKEYRLRRTNINSCSNKKKDKNIEKAKRDELRYQEEGRKKHVRNQTPDVQKRMKESFEKSERLRKKETIWDKIFFWRDRKQKKRVSHTNS